VDCVYCFWWQVNDFPHLGLIKFSNQTRPTNKKDQNAIRPALAASTKATQEPQDDAAQSVCVRPHGPEKRSKSTRFTEKTPPWVSEDLECNVALSWH